MSNGAQQPVGTIARYTVFQRLNHWLTAGCLLLLALSGLALFHPGLFFLTDLFGGGPATRFIHPWFGVVLMASFLILFPRFAGHNIWNRDDTAWMCRVGSVLSNHEERLPEIGRYNAGQKIVFWLMTLLILALFVTGLVIWDQYFFHYTTMEQKRLALLIHSVAAIVMIAVFIIHIYAAIWVRGTMRGMMSGSVTAGWAFRHHRKWLRTMARGR